MEPIEVTLTVEYHECPKLHLKAVLLKAAEVAITQIIAGDKTIPYILKDEYWRTELTLTLKDPNAIPRPTSVE